jgi:hypothetical protein
VAFAAAWCLCASIRLSSAQTIDASVWHSAESNVVASNSIDSIEAAFKKAPPDLAWTPFTQSTTTSQNKPPLPDAPDPSGARGADQDRRAADKSANKYCRFKPCPEGFIDWYMRFEDGPQVKPMTPKEKGWLAARNVIDPFNVMTILGISAISVAADSHSAYGPGFPGWGRYVGVSFSENVTSEFFGTFLICSIAHQDPHYHRMPNASYAKRILHAADQVVWTQGDNGKGMLNYSNLVGAGIDDEIGNLYVPGRRTNAAATAQRYGITLATDPIDNFITEFLPDVARRIHVQVVIVQRIIDQIATDRGTNGSS